MTPTAGEWKELAELLMPGQFCPQNYLAFETASASDAGGMMASFHIEDEARRIGEVRHNKTWQWMQAHHGYKAFLSSAAKLLGRSGRSRDEASEPFDWRAWLAQMYARRLESGRRYPRLDAHYDMLCVRWDRAIAEAMAGALDASDWQTQHRALSLALKHIQKARAAVELIHPSEVEDTAQDPESGAYRPLSNGEQSAGMLARNLEREERRLDRATQAAAAMKTRNGQIRWFLDSIFRELRVSNCGTTTGLRRLVEMLDPDSSVSDDTIGRILADAKKREAKLDAANAAWFAKQKAESESVTSPQNEAKK